MDKITQQIKQEIANDKRLSQFNYSKIPAHEHNGVDTVKISQANIIIGNKYIAFPAITNGTSSFTIPNVTNISSLSFYGVAGNNASGGSPTKFAQINGVVEFGQCFELTNVTVSLAVNSPKTIPFIQTCNFMLIDTGTLTNSISGVSSNTPSTQGYFAFAAESLSSIYATAYVSSYTNSTITINVNVVAGWILEGALILT